MNDSIVISILSVTLDRSGSLSHEYEILKIYIYYIVITIMYERVNVENIML